MDRAIGTIADRPMSASLYAGLSGIAWAAQHLGDLADEGRHQIPNRGPRVALRAGSGGHPISKPAVARTYAWSSNART
jgi:hypothetical protein